MGWVTIHGHPVLLKDKLGTQTPTGQRNEGQKSFTAGTHKVAETHGTASVSSFTATHDMVGISDYRKVGDRASEGNIYLPVELLVPKGTFKDGEHLTVSIVKDKNPGGDSAVSPGRVLVPAVVRSSSPSTPGNTKEHIVDLGDAKEPLHGVSNSPVYFPVQFKAPPGAKRGDQYCISVTR